MTEKAKPFEIKPKEIKKQIKSVNLIMNSNPKSSKNKMFLGIKRKLFHTAKNLKKDKKRNLLSIEKPIKYFIDNKNYSNDSNNDNLCIICLEKISFEEKHFLHCGHCFHCFCINQWINMDKNKCPTCKQNIECDISNSEELINLQEENNNDNNNNIIRSDNSNIMVDSLNILLLYLWFIFIFFMLKGFCFRAFPL